MRKIADGLWLLDGVPSYLVNVYLMEDWRPLGRGSHAAPSAPLT
jgi:hypothetical protein